MWSVEQPDQRDNTAERFKYCKKCWDERLNKPTTIHEIERENPRPDREERNN